MKSGGKGERDFVNRRNGSWNQKLSAVFQKNL